MTKFKVKFHMVGGETLILTLDGWAYQSVMRLVDGEYHSFCMLPINPTTKFYVNPRNITFVDISEVVDD